MANSKITYKPFGEKAILIEWPKRISHKYLDEILDYKKKLETSNRTTILDIVVAYHSINIKYKDTIQDFEKEISFLKSLHDKEVAYTKDQSYLWEIPVCYEEEYGVDLKVIAKHKNLSVEEIVNIHSSTIYDVYFIGFLPGFLYLGGLDNRLHMDRKENPRMHINRGSVAIGGKQTGVYPTSSAGGWQLIGKTPICFFKIENSPPCFAKSGDKVKFYAVSKSELKDIELQLQLKDYSSLKQQLID